MRTSRRHFLVGCSSAVAAMAGSRLRCLALDDASAATASSRETLVIVFLRGGMDGLSLLPPIAGDDRGHYEVARPNLKIPLTGNDAAIPLNDQFGLHPSASALSRLYKAGKLGIVHAVGTSGSRSHFDAMKYVELGTPGVKTTPDGWLTRHLRTAPGLGDTVLMPAFAAGSTPPTSLLGSNEVVNMVDSYTFNLGQIGHASWAGGEQWTTLRRIYQAGNSEIHRAGVQALSSAGLVESYVRSSYTPANSAKYPDGNFGSHLKLVAQLIKSGAGLRIASVDFGGWDTHENQGVLGEGHFSKQIRQVSEGLGAFYADLDESNDPWIRHVTVVVLSEFGRRIRENANLGTDHGTGNPILVLGGEVRGGFHGTWPGLHPDQRFDNADLAPTNDLRRVLSEVLIRRTGNPSLGQVFPKFSGYEPLNLVQGSDVPPDYSVPIPVTPSDLVATRLDGGVVRLSWGAGLNATHYRVERRAEANATWQFLGITSAPTRVYDDTAAPASGAPEYRVQAFSSAGEGAYSAPVSPGLTRPIEQWRLRYFGTPSGIGAAADDAVSTEDGLNNFTKYALGLDPLTPATEYTTGFTPGRPRVEVGQGTVSLVYVRPSDRSDVRYAVLATADLQTWTPVDQSSDGTGSGMERLRVTVPMAQPSAQFLKLTVTPQ
ncbi:MAG: DUF1501 domain-containing protein [Verrucomicrobiales bacterium]|nr:DUF1501 domain-containing protein [Verrucomicrobiales bacterium]